MKNPFRRKHKYRPHNPAPQFATDGGKELWLLLLDMRDEMGALKATDRLLMALMLILVVATVVKDYL